MNSFEKPVPTCKRFSGYKPCFPDHNCWLDGCKDNIPIGTKILIINLDAMGDVLMTTAQLPAIKRKFPESTVYWITLKNTAPLLLNNDFVDHVYTYDFESLSILTQMNFDYVMNVDKSQRSCSLANSLNAVKKLGFGLNHDGKIIPLNLGAFYNYNLGMDDNLKFRLNTKTGQEYLGETFELPYQKDEYVFNLADEEKKFISDYKKEKGITENDFVIGFNTGCSGLYPNKKMTVDQHLYLINKLLAEEKYKIALFGGPEDTERNNLIYSHFKGKTSPDLAGPKRIINTPTNLGARRGACFEDIADIIITGDSFGMHLGIALKKFIIVWFGVSCWTEIDLYGRGIKLYPEDLFCSPCWKKECPFSLECIKQIDLDRIVSEVDKYYQSSLSVRRQV